MAQQSELVDIMLSFLEVTIHGILFYRAVYPPALFERHRAYGMAVWKSRHPKLNDAIHRILHSLHAPLNKGVIECVCVVILDGHGRAVEQYSLDVTFAAHDVAATYSDLETMLAAAMTKLALLEINLPRLGHDCSFTVLARSHEVLVGPHDPPKDAAAAGGSSRGRTVDGSSGGPSQMLHPGGLWMRVDPGDPEAVLDATAVKGAGPDGSAAPPSALHIPASGAYAEGSSADARSISVIKTIHAGPMYMRLSVASMSTAVE